MKANETSLNRFLAQTDTQFMIPVYQRNYDWSLAQCSQLFDDILRVGCSEIETSHFVGSIVYIHDNVYSVAGVRELSIIDGQQRLTTVTLVYIALFALAKEINDRALVNRIQETYLINKFSQDEEKLKLRPTEHNDKALKFLLRNDPNDEYNEYSKIIDNYNYFKGRITEQNKEHILQGLNKLIFVEISLERDKDDPQKIFESLNSTGLELSQSDLIRNYILMGLKHKDQTHMYENYWRHIEVNATQEETNANKVSDFIRDFLTLENRDIPNKGKVYLEFKKKYPISEIENLEKILTKIKKYSIYYNKFINPNNEPDIEIRNQFSLISRLEINVAYPFLLEIYNDYSSGVINKSTLIEMLELLQSFTWRRFVIGLPTNSLNKIFMRLYEDVDPSDYVSSFQRVLLKKKSSQRFPRDKEVIATLRDRDVYGIQTKNRTYLLEKLENFENKEPVKIDGNSDITVEHIFPQNPDPKWKFILGDEQYSTMKEKYLNTLANLTLSGNNGKLGNRYFTEKRDMNDEGREQGYKFSRLWLNKYIGSLDKWDVEEVEKRFDHIADRFLKIWKFPPVSLVDETTENEEVNIFDADEATFKKLDYAIFFDQKLDVSTVTDLYAEVMKSLFELNPEAFFGSETEGKLGLTKDRESCSSALPLNDTYFIEKQLDSVNKFARIRFILSIMDLTDELFIKYASE